MESESLSEFLLFERNGTRLPVFYIYRAQDIKRIQEALDDGCGYDAPGSFAAWLSKKTTMHAWKMDGKRYDIGDVESYERVKGVFE